MLKCRYRFILFKWPPILTGSPRLLYGAGVKAEVHNIQRVKNISTHKDESRISLSTFFFREEHDLGRVCARSKSYKK